MIPGLTKGTKIYQTVSTGAVSTVPKLQFGNRADELLLEKSSRMKRPWAFLLFGFFMQRNTGSRYFLLLIVFLAIASLGIDSYENSQVDPLYTDLGYVADFQFTDQLGRPVSLDDLRGKVWVASFFFSTCKECSKHQNQMAALQEQMAGWPDVMLVSFSVDPEKDTPEQMNNFAKGFGADPNRWIFLTGAKEKMYDLIQHSFYQSVEPNPDPEPGAEYLHTFRFMIVDHRGKIRGSLDVKDSPARVPELGGRVKRLVQAKYLPAVNASLNGLSGILLLLGYVSVRRRAIGLHKILMLSAFVVSALFLGCYLYYHFAVLDGQPTRFSGEGIARIVYFAILISHTVLAVIVAPLAIISVYLGLRDKLTRHIAIARWTLPLWLYVSVTGVIVYWMLYQLYPPV